MPDEAFLERSRKRMEEIDSLPADIRAVVHDEGWTVVKAYLDAGVTSARRIRHLINVVREGSAAYGNGTKGEQTSTFLIAELRRKFPHLAVVDREPTKNMVEASCAVVLERAEGGGILVGKYEKHRRRLQAAIAAGERNAFSNSKDFRASTKVLDAAPKPRS